MQAESFAAVTGDSPRVLVLGTMPGQVSLGATQYYAHPRNAFWPIAVSTCLNQPPDYKTSHAMPYEDRLRLLTKNRIALWDVLASCERPGSLDAAIVRDSEKANPILQWIGCQPSLQRVCFNGKTAAALYKRHISKSFSNDDNIEFITLPSTSPAMASLNLSEKLTLWKPALR